MARLPVRARDALHAGSLGGIGQSGAATGRAGGCALGACRLFRKRGGRHHRPPGLDVDPTCQSSSHDAHGARDNVNTELDESREPHMTVEETPTPTPRFATVVRGYDRLQVDDYVEHLHRWIEQADYRAQQCEVAATRANSEADQMRRRL